jgi:hypothetical protein
VPLLGWPLLVTMGAVMVAATLAALVLWDRVRGPVPARVAQRLLLLVGAQAATLVLAAAALNNYGFFYGSWSDLFGATSKDVPPVTSLAAGPGHQDGAPSGAVTEDASIAGVTSWSTQPQWATRGRVEALQVTGAHSRLSEETLVYLPPQYFQRAYAHTAFPAVEVMTGYPGATRLLVERLHYPDLLLTGIQAHKVRPMVLVMLRPTVTPPRDTECTDVPAGPQALTYFAEDLPRAISQNLRVRPTGWGAMGDSTGGYCATKMAMTHSSVFAAAVSLSGYYHALKDATTGDLWGGATQLRSLNDLKWLLRHQPAPPVAVLASVGATETGPNGVRELRAFAELVHKPMTITTMTVPRGAHNFASWRSVMPQGFEFLSAHLAPS